VRQYYDHLYRRSRQSERVEIETRVSIIAQNFLNYLKNLIEKAFTEVSLCSFQYNQLQYEKHLEMVAAHPSDQEAGTKYEHLKLQKSDFERCLQTMGSAHFRIDLNFAFLIYRLL